MTDTTEGQEQNQEIEQHAEPSAQEAEARKLGWRPEAEWDDSGNAEWLDAEQFVQRNNRLRERGDNILKAEVSSLKSEVRSMKQTLGEAADHLKKADQRAYAKALKDLEAKADKAVEEGDTDAYRAAKGEMKDLAQEVKAEAKPVTQPRDDPAFQGWLPENAWYDPRGDGFDPELAGYADSIAPQIARTGLVGKPFYDRITTEMKKKFPDRFGNQRRKSAPAVEGGGSGGGGNGKTLWSQVPREDQPQFKRFVDQGLYKDTKEDREKYAEVYLNPNG